MAETASLQIKVTSSGINAAGYSLGNITKEGVKAERATDNFTRAMTAASIAAGALATGLGVRELAQYSDQWKDVTNRLKLATNSSQELAAAQKAVFDISQDTRSELGATAELYQRLSMNAGDYITSQEDLANIASTVNKAIGLSGASAESAQGAIVQFSQGLAAGALRGEEFNSVVENAPRLAKLLADGLGVPVGALRELAGEGKLTSEAVINAIRSQTDVINSEYATLLPKISEGWTKIGNSVTQAVGKLDGATGASEKAYNMLSNLAESIDEVTGNAELMEEIFDSAENIVILLTAAIGGKLTASMVAAIASSKTLSTMYNIMTGSATAATIKTNALGQVISKTTVQMRIAAGAAGMLRGALAFLGGPVGIAITAASALAMFAASSKDTKTDVSGLSKEVKELIGQTDNLARANLSSALGDAETKLENIRKRMEKLNNVKASGMGVGSAIGKGQAALAEEEKEQLQAILNIKQQIAELDANPPKKEEKKKVGGIDLGEDLTEDFEKTKARLAEEIALFDSTGKAAKLRYQLEYGELKNLDDAKKKSLEEQIQQLEQLEQAKITSDNFDAVKESLMTEEEEILASYERRKEAILAYTEATETEKNELITRLTEETNEQLGEINQGFWDKYLKSMEENLMNMDDLTSNMINNFSNGMGNALESMVFDSENLGDAFDKLMVGMARATINALGQMVGQWLAYQAVQLIVGKTGQAAAMNGKIAEAAIGVNMAGINAFASTAAIPVTGAGLAPAAMTAAIAATTPLATSITSLATAGMFDHGGMIPSGRVGVVGEYGAELVTGPAFVTSRRTTESSHAGSESTQAPNVTIVQEFNIHGSRDSELEAMLRAAASQGAEEGYNKVYQDMRSNGAIKQLTRR